MKVKGFTLLQLLITIAALGILVSIALAGYQRYIRYAEFQNARAALLQNAHFMEQFYHQHKSFKATSTTWPKLPVPSTAKFCIRPQGLARGMPDAKFTLKAVAFDKNNEPRVLRINQDLLTIVCETSTVSCDDKDDYFRGGSKNDKKCRVFK